MIDRLYNRLLYISILLISTFSITNGNEITCGLYQRQCTDLGFSWCCPQNEPCGYYWNQCKYYRTTTPSPDISATSIAIIVFVSLILFGLLCSGCACLCHNHQYSRSSVVSPTVERRVFRDSQSPQRVAYDQVFYNSNSGSVSMLTPSIYEEQPPSYEVAIGNLSTKHQSESAIISSPLPTTSNVELEQTHF